jgi:hypothetical protein
MAEPEVEIDPTNEGAPAGDVEMAEDGAGGVENGAAELPNIEPEVPTRVTFLE